MNAFGRRQMDIEKEKLRNVLSRAISQCGRRKNSKPRVIDHFCENYDKHENLIIDEVRNIQHIKSIEIMSMLNDNSTKQR